ncbi:TPA: DUF3775 domain-containing protein [Photobacterium damselae]
MDSLDITTVHHIIELAEVCYPINGEPQGVSISDALDSLDNPDVQALYHYITSLSPAQLAELYALMQIGRNLRDPEDWNTLYDEAISSDSSDSARYIALNRQLAAYLRNGLARLNH